MIVEGTKENFQDALQKGIVLVDFFATWCGPCKMLHPVLEEVLEEENLTIVKVDIDKNESLAVEYGVMSVPTMILFKDGHEMSKSIGYKDKQTLLNWIRESI